jgi:hypothetical protein
MQTTQSIAPTLSGIIADVNPAIRLSVIDSITQGRTIQGQWLGPDKSGCFMALATMRVMGMSRRRFRKQQSLSRISALALGVTRDRVRAGYTEWDGLSQNDLDKFIEGLRAQAAAIRAANPPSIVQRTIHRVREFASA